MNAGTNAGTDAGTNAGTDAGNGTDAGTGRAACTRLVIRVLAEITEVPAEKISADTRLRDELDVDSLATIELATMLAEETGEDLTEEDFAGALVVADVVDVVARSGS